MPVASHTAAPLKTRLLIFWYPMGLGFAENLLNLQLRQIQACWTFSDNPA